MVYLVLKVKKVKKVTLDYVVFLVTPLQVQLVVQEKLDHQEKRAKKEVQVLMAHLGTQEQKETQVDDAMTVGLEDPDRKEIVVQTDIPGQLEIQVNQALQDLQAREELTVLTVCQEKQELR